jgi:hypothetical protein
MRHPIYLAFLLMQISVLLLTSNWFIGFCGLAIIVSVIAIRVPEEEKLADRTIRRRISQLHQESNWQSSIAKTRINAKEEA